MVGILISFASPWALPLARSPGRQLSGYSIVMETVEWFKRLGWGIL